MRFVLHGEISEEVRAALIAAGHGCYALEEVPEDVAELLGELGKRQWDLMTVDGEFVRQIYERKVAFGGVVVQILGGAENVVERLFERYPRLTGRRLYMVTRSRVKIRQLPGANER